jgi:hypothetical protein
MDAGSTSERSKSLKEIEAEKYLLAREEKRIQTSGEAPRTDFWTLQNLSHVAITITHPACTKVACVHSLEPFDPTAFPLLIYLDLSAQCVRHVPGEFCSTTETMILLEAANKT